MTVMSPQLKTKTKPFSVRKYLNSEATEKIDNGEQNVNRLLMQNMIFGL